MNCLIRANIFVFLLLAAGQLYTQLPHSISPQSLFYSPQLDTATLLSDKSLKSPWGAVARSAIMPGWGQIYTEQYVKSVLAFSLNGFLVYQIYNYEQKWREEHNEGYRAKRNLYTWYFSLAYLLTMVDAYVDAYLYKFDEAIKISYHLEKQEEIWISALEVSISWH
jgi:hypothetical protein